VKKAIIICGPTAVGKTAVAIQVAHRLRTAVISADSRQCYKEMCIGTAKPTAEELNTVPHYFIDAFSVCTVLSAADYESLALGYLDEIFSKQGAAVVCGGTGLYIKALCEGLDAMPAVDEAIVATIENIYAQEGLPWLQQAVQQEDPEFYAQGEIHNPARLLRALSFIRTTGKSIVQYRSGNKKQRDFEVVKIGLQLPRELLYDRINKRVDDMMAMGLLAEAEGLYPYNDNKNLQTVGYTELFEYMDGKCTLQKAIEKIKQHTRNYAKRQMTWFTKDKEIKWFSADDRDVVEKILAFAD